MNIILAIILVFIIPKIGKFAYWSMKMQPIWECIYMMGALGRGKSCSIARVCHRWKGEVWCPSKSVYNGNYRKKGYGEVHYFEIEEWIDGGCPPFPEKSLVVIDEMGLIANGRDYKKCPKQLIKYFKFVRKARNRIYLISQRPDIDKAIRDLCSQNLVCDRFGALGLHYFLTPVMGNKMVIAPDGKKKNECIDGYERQKGIPRMIFLPKYFKMYDSNSMDLFGSGGNYWEEYSLEYAGRLFGEKVVDQ